MKNRKNRKHSLSEKMKVIKNYRFGYGSTTISRKRKIAKSLVLKWIRAYQAHGLKGLEKQPRAAISAAIKQQAVRAVLEECLSCETVALKYRVSISAIYSWSQRVREQGYASLLTIKPGRPTKLMGRPKKKQPETEMEMLQEEVRYLRAENACLKKLKALAEERTVPASAGQPKHALSHLLKASSMARATYYYHQKLLANPDRNEPIRRQVCSIYHAHKGRYGYQRIALELRNQSVPVNHKRVVRLMRECGLKSLVRVKRYRSYKGNVGRIAPNILERNFSALSINQKWVTDITEFTLFGQKRYLSPILDLYDGEVVSYTVNAHPNLHLVTSMLQKAVKGIKKGSGLILHSDQGWHYQHAAYQKMLKSKGIAQSMSRKGNCLDNAAMENFFGLLKSELLYLQKFSSIEEFEKELECTFTIITTLESSKS